MGAGLGSGGALERSNRDVLESIQAVLTALGAGVAGPHTFGPAVVDIDAVAEIGVTLTIPTGDIIPTSDITPGTYDVARMRAGSSSTIVSGSASSEGPGRVYVQYTFADATWNTDDLFTFKFMGIQVDNDGTTVDYPDLYFMGRVSDLTTIEGKVDTIDTVVDGIQTDLSNGTDGLGALKILIDALNDIAPSDVLTQCLGAIDTAIGATPTGSSLADILHKDTNYTFNKASDSLEAIADAAVTTAEVNTEVDNALDTAVPTSPTADSLNDILSKTDNNTFDRTSDSLEAIADAAVTTAQVNTEVDNALDTAVPASPTADSLNDILSKTDNNTFDRASDSLEAIADAAVTTAEVNTEVDNALDTAVPNTPTGASLNDILSKLDGANAYDNTTDSLEAISDKVTDLGAVRSVGESAGDITMAGTEQTIYERAETYPFAFLGGHIYNTTISAGGLVTIKVYIKYKSGGTYVVYNGGTVQQNVASSFLTSLPMRTRPSATDTPFPPLWNTYGIRITLDQETEGAQYVIYEYEFYDTV